MFSSKRGCSALNAGIQLQARVFNCRHGCSAAIMHIQLQNECSAASIPIQLQERIFNCRQTFAAISLLQVNLKMRGRFAATKWTLQQLSRPLLFPAAKVLADLELQKRPVAIGATTRLFCIYRCLSVPSARGQFHYCQVDFVFAQHIIVEYLFQQRASFHCSVQSVKLPKNIRHTKHPPPPQRQRQKQQEQQQHNHRKEKINNKEKCCL